MDKLNSGNIKLNKEKCQFRQQEIDFLGFVINKDGVKADPRKTEAILKMPDPTDVAELRRFLGMVNHIGRYLQNLSSVLQPVTELLEKDRAWTWRPPQISAVAKVKEMLTSAPTLAYFDPDKWVHMRAAMGLAQFFCKSTQMDSVLLPLLLELSQRARESMPK